MFNLLSFIFQILGGAIVSKLNPFLNAHEDQRLSRLNGYYKQYCTSPNIGLLGSPTCSANTLVSFDYGKHDWDWKIEDDSEWTNIFNMVEEECPKPVCLKSP